MITEQLKVIELGNDKDFLQFARFYTREHHTLQEYIDITTKIKQRCKNMGYSWVAGCCGTNHIGKLP